MIELMSHIHDSVKHFTLHNKPLWCISYHILQIETLAIRDVNHSFKINELVNNTADISTPFWLQIPCFSHYSGICFNKENLDGSKQWWPNVIRAISGVCAKGHSTVWREVTGERVWDGGDQGSLFTVEMNLGPVIDITKGLNSTFLNPPGMASCTIETHPPEITFLRPPCS